MIRKILLVFVALVVVQGNAAAQTSPALPKESVEELARAAHNALPEAKLGSGELIGAELAKTLQYPMIPYDMIEFIVLRGHIAGFAAHCGLDWQNKYYGPLMSFLRSRETTYTDYQWAYVGMLHGISMGTAEKTMEGKPCPPEMKDNLLKEAK
jgi:hypothetical protein